MFLPLLIYAAGMAVLWLRSGLMPAGDTPFFLGGAEKMLQGLPLEGTELLYRGYISFVAVHQMLGWGPSAVALTQVLLGAAAVLALTDLGRRVGGRAAGFIAGGLYALNLDVHRFNFYVLSDAVFTSAVVLVTYAAFRAAKAPGRAWIAAAFAGTLILVLMRVNGWFFAAAVWTYLAMTRIPGARILRVAVAAVCVALAAVGLLGTVDAGGHRAAAGALMAEGRVIWGDANSVIAMPPSEGTSGGALDYCGAHPRACVALAAARIGSALGHTRSFYSARHNAVVWATLPLLYLAALFGLWRRRREGYAMLWAAICALQLGLIGVTGADWDGRFILTVLPLVTLLAALGITDALGLRRAAVTRSSMASPVA